MARNIEDAYGKGGGKPHGGDDMSEEKEQKMKNSAEGAKDINKKKIAGGIKMAESEYKCAKMKYWKKKVKTDNPKG